MVHYDPVVDTSGPDPFAVYQRLRDDAPVYHNAERDIWALTRFDDVMAAVHDPERFISGKGINVTSPPGEGSPLTSVISLDNPRHDQLRKLVARGFTSRQMGSFEPWVRAATQRLLDAFVDDGSVEFVRALSAPLPILVISELLGIDEGDRDAFKDWSDAMVHQTPDDPASMEHARDALQSIITYFTGVIDARRAAPTDDMVSLLLAAEVDGERLSEQDILGFCFLLIVAGTETTTNLIGNGVIALAQHPEQREALVRNPDLIPSAVEEMLRWCGPVHQLGRTTTSAVDLHGVTMPEGARVAMVWAAANHDEREFGPDAHEFRIDRPIPRHLAFGHGIHYCMGASLARLEARVAFEELLMRIPKWEIAEPEIKYAPSPSVRGPLRLPLEFTRSPS